MINKEVSVPKPGVYAKIFSRRIVLTSLLMALFVFGASCASVPLGRFQAKSLLWEVHDPDTKASSYFFGTIHMMKKGQIPFVPKYREALQKSRKVYFEMDLKPGQDALQLVMLAQMRNGERISNFVDKKTFDQWSKRYAERTQMPLEAVDTWYPTLAAAPLLASAAKKSKGSGEVISVEEHIKSFAVGKSFGALETMADQVNAIARIPIDKQLEGFREMIESSDGGAEDLQGMMENYLLHDIGALYASSAKSMRKSGAEGPLLNDRNQRWVEALLPELQKGGIFVAVGALHLPGPRGVLELLAQKGYVVRPVFP